MVAPALDQPRRGLHADDPLGPAPHGVEGEGAGVGEEVEHGAPAAKRSARRRFSRWSQ